MGRELDASRELDTSGSPHPEENPLSEAELLTMVRWIDLGATFLGGDGADSGESVAMNPACSLARLRLPDRRGPTDEEE